MWKVRAEIKGSFVRVEEFDTKEAAIDFADAKFNECRWDSIDVWEVPQKGEE